MRINKNQPRSGRSIGFHLAWSQPPGKTLPGPHALACEGPVWCDRGGGGLGTPCAADGLSCGPHAPSSSHPCAQTCALRGEGGRWEGPGTHSSVGLVCAAPPLPGEVGVYVRLPTLPPGDPAPAERTRLQRGFEPRTCLSAPWIGSPGRMSLPCLPAPGARGREELWHRLCI